MVRPRSFADIHRRHAGIPSRGLQLRKGLSLRAVSSPTRWSGRVPWRGLKAKGTANGSDAAALHPQHPRRCHTDANTAATLSPPSSSNHRQAAAAARPRTLSGSSLFSLTPLLAPPPGGASPPRRRRERASACSPARASGAPRGPLPSAPPTTAHTPTHSARA